MTTIVYNLKTQNIHETTNKYKCSKQITTQKFHITTHKPNKTANVADKVYEFIHKTKQIKTIDEQNTY